MKTIEEKSNVTLSTQAEARKLTIAANSKAFRELISGLYSDKAFAITRELFANAWDAHVVTGDEERPFEVVVPNTFNPMFSVRDYGVSMSHELVMDVYSSLFSSTKDDPDNDESNNYTGKFGLGSKTPFAYTDAFQLTTYKDGVARSYDVFMDAGMPKIVLFHSQKTEEENGVLVSFPVDESDHDDFCRATKTALEGFDVMPKLYGLEAPDFPDPHEASNNWRLYNITTWKSPFAYNELRVRQGTVIYPLTARSIPNLPSHLEHLFNLNAVIDVPIGELEVNTSREALSYDERTSQNIITHLESMHRDLTDMLVGSLQKCKTYSEFCSLFVKLRTDIPGNLFNHLASDLKFKGRKYNHTVPFIDMIWFDRWVITKHTNEDGEEVSQKFKDREEAKDWMNANEISYSNYTIEQCSKTHNKYEEEFCVYDSNKRSRLSNMNFNTDRGRSTSFSANCAGDRYLLDTGVKIVFVIENTADKKLSLAPTRFRSLSRDVDSDATMVWIKADEFPDKLIRNMWLYAGRPEFEIINLASVEINRSQREIAFTGGNLFAFYKEVIIGDSFYMSARDVATPDDADDLEFPDAAYYVHMHRGDIKTGEYSRCTLGKAFKRLVEAGIIEDLPIVGIPASYKHKIKAFDAWKPLESIVEFIPKIISSEYLVKASEQRVYDHVYKNDKTCDVISGLFNVGANNEQLKKFSLLGKAENTRYSFGVEKVATRFLRFDIKHTARKNPIIWDLYSMTKMVKAHFNHKPGSNGFRSKEKVDFDLIDLIPVKIREEMNAKTEKMADEMISKYDKLVETFKEAYPLWDCIKIYSFYKHHIADYFGLSVKEY